MEDVWRPAITSAIVFTARPADDSVEVTYAERDPLEGRTVHWRLSKHARAELIRRAIPLSLIEDTIVNPQQIVPERDALRAYQSRIMWPDGRVFLLRLIVDDNIDPIVVVTAYRTSKVDKYWREDEDLLRS